MGCDAVQCCGMIQSEVPLKMEAQGPPKRWYPTTTPRDVTTQRTWA